MGDNTQNRHERTRVITLLQGRREVVRLTYLTKSTICCLRSSRRRAGGARPAHRCATPLQTAACRGDALHRLQIHICRLRWAWIRRRHRLFPRHHSLSPDARRRRASITDAIRRHPWTRKHYPEGHRTYYPSNLFWASTPARKPRRRRRIPVVAGEIARAEQKMGNGSLSLAI